jgi:hypothetical protein
MKAGPKKILEKKGFQAGQGELEKADKVLVESRVEILQEASWTRRCAVFSAA